VFLAYRFLAVASMFLAAYAACSWIGTASTISGWIALEKHQIDIPGLRFRAKIWFSIAVVMPFTSALLLGLGRRKRIRSSGAARPEPETISHVSTTRIVAYGIRLAISVLGALGFVVLLFSLGWIIYILKSQL
jgi:hypothetical protein